MGDIINVRKRNGHLQEFDGQKIEQAIKKAFLVSNLESKLDIVPKITQDVINKINENDEKYSTSIGKVIDLEEIQDLVEESLVKYNLYRVAKNYILYREKKNALREKKNVFVDIDSLFGDYLTLENWRVKENANMGYSYQGLVLTVNSLLQSQYWLHLYTEEIKNAHKQGFIHLHDLSQLSGYCSGWSLYDIILEGFNLEGNGCCSAPAKHLDSLFGQIVNFIGTLQNEWAGAQGINSFDTLCAPFVYYDDLSYKEVKQYIQRFVYNLNTSSRWGGQCPFSNITFDIIPSSNFANQPVIIGGKPQNKTYKEFQREMLMIVKAYFEILLEGDAFGNPFTFPIPTINITKDFPWDSEIGELIFKVTGKYGSPYFQNFINSEISPEDVRSFCCRLQLDKRQIEEKFKKLENKTGGLFGSGDLTGSIGVVTINLAKLAYIAKDTIEFFTLLSHYARLAKDSLEFKRQFLTEQYDKGLYPFTKRYLGKRKFDTYFSTIGIIGGHEACINLLGKGIETKEGVNLMKKTLNYLRELLIEFQKETGNMYNLEAVPGEGASYRLAKIDKEMYKDIYTSGTEETPYYTNSTQLPVTINDTWFALLHQNNLQPLYTGGTVFHVFVGEDLSNTVRPLQNFVKTVFTKTKLPYLTITPTFSVCKKHGYIAGEHFNCPICDNECNVFSRVVGYYRPIQRWNEGKKEEFKDRNYFAV